MHVTDHSLPAPAEESAGILCDPALELGFSLFDPNPHAAKSAPLQESAAPQSGELPPAQVAPSCDDQEPAAPPSPEDARPGILGGQGLLFPDFDVPSAEQAPPAGKPRQGRLTPEARRAQEEEKTRKAQEKARLRQEKAQEKERRAQEKAESKRLEAEKVARLSADLGRNLYNTCMASPVCLHLPTTVTDKGIVGFAGPAHAQVVLDRLANARELSLDLETTALTRWSEHVPTPRAAKLGTGESVSSYLLRVNRLAVVADLLGCGINDLPKTAQDISGFDDARWAALYTDTLKGRGKVLGDLEADSEPRARILSLGILDDPAHPWQVAIDFDLFRTPQEREKLLSIVHALHGKVWSGHNLSFDLGWLRQYDAEVTPSVMLDTFLLTLTVAPHFEAILVDRILTDGSAHARTEDFDVVDFIPDFKHVQTPGYEINDVQHQVSGWLNQFSKTLAPGSPTRKAVMKILLERQAAQFRADTGEASRGLPLSVLSAALLADVLDKGYQKPHNWMVPVLSEGHFAYCLGDITQPPKIARLLLGLSMTAPIDNVLARLGVDARGVPLPNPPKTVIQGASAWYDTTRATDLLVRMQHKGLHFDREGAKKYRADNQSKALAAWEEVVKLAPGMAEFRARYLDKLGQSRAFKKTLVKCLQQLAPEIEHPKTATGAESLGAKDVLAAYKGTPAEALNVALTKVSGYIKRANMAQAYLELTETCEQGRLHSIVSIATMTTRTASQDPNLQNAPNAKEFRSLFTGQDGKKIIAGDFTAIEMCTAAALAERAWAQFRQMLDLAQDLRDAYSRTATSSRVSLHSASKALEDYVRYNYGPFFQSILGDVRPPLPGERPSLLCQLLDVLRDQPETLPDTWPDGGVDTPIARPDVETSQVDDWADYYAAVFARVIRKMYRNGALRVDPAQDTLMLSEVFRRGVDVHLATALTLSPGEVDLQGKTPVDFLSSLSSEDAEALKKKLKGPRQSAKACNFGLLYGMQALKLHLYGIVTYGLSWDPEEAIVARDLWFDLYPELEFWHLVTRMRKDKVAVGDVLKFSTQEVQMSADGTVVEAPGKETVELGARGNRLSKLFRAFTLSGRPVCATQMPAVLNYQDQGSAAEIAFKALIKLHEEQLTQYLVAFVHDEFVLEVPPEDAPRVEKRLHDILCEVGTQYLAPFGGIEVRAEVACGDYWIH